MWRSVDSVHCGRCDRGPERPQSMTTYNAIGSTYTATRVADARIGARIIAALGDARTQVMQLVDVYRARIVDVSPESLVIETTGAEDKIDSLLEVLRPYGVIEMVRTGRVSMTRGGGVPHGLKTGTPRPSAAADHAEDTSSGSV